MYLHAQRVTMNVIENGRILSEAGNPKEMLLKNIDIPNGEEKKPPSGERNGLKPRKAKPLKKDCTKDTKLSTRKNSEREQLLIKL